MHRLPILIALFIGLQTTAFSQWEAKNISTSFTLSCVDFVNDDLGFVTGGNKIFKTANGGDNWTTCFAANNMTYFEDIFVIDADHIVAVGKDLNASQSVIAKTANGGDNWQLTALAGSSFLKSVFFINPEIGFCSGGNGVILRTTDACNSWQEMSSGTNSNLESIFFVSESTGFAVGGDPINYVILKTQDGGEHWTPLTAPLNSNFQSVYFTDKKTGYIVGWNGAILKTEDAGDHWFIQNSVAMSGNLEVEFTDSMTGYIVGGSSNETLIQKTTNGGDMWVDVSPQLTDGLVSINFPSFNVGYAVGSTGTVLKTTSGGVSTAVSNPEFAGTVEVYPNPTSGLLQVVSKSNSAIARIRVYDNNGRLIQDRQFDSIAPEIDLSELAPDVYYLEIHSEDARSVISVVKR